MQTRRRGFYCLVLFVFALSHGTAVAQPPQLSLSTTIAGPGSAVTATVSGTPGQRYALIASSTNAGFAFGGVQLAVGADVVVLAVGTLDGSGSIQLPVVAPFLGTTLDRYYLQAVTSQSAAFVPLAASPGVVIRNADLVSNLVGAPGPVGPVGPVGPAGPTGPAGPATGKPSRSAISKGGANIAPASNSA